MKQTIVGTPITLRVSSPSVRHPPPSSSSSSSSRQRLSLMFRSSSSSSRPWLVSSSFWLHARKSLFYGSGGRPKPQFVTALAAVCVLFAFITFLRSAAIVPAHPTTLPSSNHFHHHHHHNAADNNNKNNKREHQQYRHRLRSRLRQLRGRKKKRVIGLNGNNHYKHGDDDVRSSSSRKDETFTERRRYVKKGSFVNHTRVVAADGSHFFVRVIEHGGRQSLVSAKHNEDDPNNNNNDNDDTEDFLDFGIQMTTSKSTLHVHSLLPPPSQQQQNQLDNAKINNDIARIAFFIQVSSSNVRMLPRLLLKLWHPSHTYLIHFDLKINNITPRNFKRTIQANKKLATNVFFLPSDEITYKGVSMLLNTLSAMEFLLVLRAQREWNYFINVSGADYPLVNAGVMGYVLGRREIDEKNMTFLQIAADKTFWNRMKHSRFDHIFYDTALSSTVTAGNTNNSAAAGEDAHSDHHHHHHNTALIKTWVSHPLLSSSSKPNDNNDSSSSSSSQFIQAEAWIIAHHSFVHHAVHSTYARKLLLYLSLMQDPEEHFFAMLAWNTPRFNQTLSHHALRAIFWEYDGKMAGQHPYYVDEYNATMADFPFWKRHVRTSPCFFVRKVRRPRSGLLSRIDRYMSGTTHLKVDGEKVEMSVRSMKRFVECIVRRPHPTDRVHTYNVCH